MLQLTASLPFMGDAREPPPFPKLFLSSYGLFSVTPYLTGIFLFYRNGLIPREFFGQAISRLPKPTISGFPPRPGPAVACKRVVKGCVRRFSGSHEKQSCLLRHSLEGTGSRGRKERLLPLEVRTTHQPSDGDTGVIQRLGFSVETLLTSPAKSPCVYLLRQTLEILLNDGFST